MHVAYCFRNGQVAVGRRAPKGSLELCRSPGRRLRKIVEVVARHAYDGKTLLVPGIPEAETDVDALKAARRFSDELRKRLASRRSIEGGLL